MRCSTRCVKAKGEIKLTFSSTLGAGAGRSSNGVERSMKVESQEAASNNATVSTTSHADLGDPDDIVSEFLGQINHATMAADGPPLVDEGPRYDQGPPEQRGSSNAAHDGQPERYVDGGRLPTPLVYEPDSKLHGYGVDDNDLLPVTGGGDTGGGPAAETLKKMAALHRRLEENTGSSSAPDYEHGYAGGGRHAMYAAPPYQLPVSYCTGNSRGRMVYGAGASKPLSHYPATAVPTASLPPAAAAAFPQYPTPEPQATGSSFYMSQSQCVDFRLSHPGVHGRAGMSQSAAVQSAAPFRAQTPPSSAAAWSRLGGGYPAYPQQRYPPADDRGGWIPSPYARTRNPTVNGSEHRGRVYQAYRGNQEQSFAVVSGGVEGGLQPPPPPPAYSDFVRQKQRLQFDRKWNHSTSESRWRRRPWTRHHDFTRSGNPDLAPTPAPIPASGQLTSADVEFPVGGEPLCQEFFFDTYSNSSTVMDNTDLSFIDDIFNVP